MIWPLVPQQIVTGLLNGGVIALIALGVVLIYKSSEVFNFAQGHTLMIGAFLTWWFAGGDETGAEFFNLPLWAAVIMAMVVAVLIGLLIERLTLRPMTGQPLISIILMTLGLSQLLQGLAIMVFGVVAKGNFPALYSPSEVFKIPFPGVFMDQIIIKKALLAAFVVAIAAAVILMLYFQLTKSGLAMRATSENHDVARSVGIKVSTIFGTSWAIAGIVATLGGVLLATISGASLNLTTVVLVAFPAVLLGGLESLPGAIVGGLCIGLAQAIVQASTLIEVRSASEIAPYILLLIVLVIRPEGLFGLKRIERV